MVLKTSASSAENCVDELNSVWLTRKELAARWKMPPATLAQWAHGRRGPRYGLFGRHVRYRLSDVIEWEEAQLGAKGAQVGEAAK